jgi:hypothetical protein
MVEPRGAGMALIKLSLAEPSYLGYFVLEVADGPIGLHTRKKENVPCRSARLNSNVLHCFWC